MKKITALLLVIVLIITAAGCGRANGKETATPTPEPTATPAPTPTPGPHVPTIAFVIANQQFNFKEYEACRVLFTIDQYKILTAGQQTGTAVSMDGKEVTVDTAIGAVNADELDALIVIGGSGATALYDDTALQALIQAVYAAGKPVGAICLAPVTLANAELLSGRDATVYPDESAVTALTDAGANYIEDSDVVTDGTIVTANGPDASNDFAVAVQTLLGGTTMPS